MERPEPVGLVKVHFRGRHVSRPIDGSVSPDRHSRVPDGDDFLNPLGQVGLNQMTPDEVSARRIDDQLTHLWMVRTFLKHCEEAEEEDELQEVYRELYDYMHALGPAADRGDWAAYLKLARKKLRKLQAAAALFSEIQPEISSHTNFIMAERSLRLCVAEIVAQVESSHGTPSATRSSSPGAIPQEQ